MYTANRLSKWIPVEEYAVDAEMPARELIRMIVDDELRGERHGNRWRVVAPLVALVPTGAVDRTYLLKGSACRIGPYVTAGRGELGTTLRFCDPSRPAALAAINTAMQAPAELPIEIWLNGERFLVDLSLWVDLGAALVEYQTLMDPSIEALL
jgi:hypothetical protein